MFAAPISENSNFKGNLAEAEIAAAGIRAGVIVHKPLVEHTRYDLIFDVDGALVRVQCNGPDWSATS